MVQERGSGGDRDWYISRKINTGAFTFSICLFFSTFQLFEKICLLIFGLKLQCQSLERVKTIFYQNMYDYCNLLTHLKPWLSDNDKMYLYIGIVLDLTIWICGIIRVVRCPPQLAGQTDSWAETATGNGPQLTTGHLSILLILNLAIVLNINNFLHWISFLCRFHIKSRKLNKNEIH